MSKRRNRGLFSALIGILSVGMLLHASIALAAPPKEKSKIKEPVPAAAPSFPPPPPTAPLESSPVDDSLQSDLDDPVLDLLKEEGEISEATPGPSPEIAPPVKEDPKTETAEADIPETEDKKELEEILAPEPETASVPPEDEVLLETSVPVGDEELPEEVAKIEDAPSAESDDSAPPSSASASVRRFNPRIPMYQQLRPSWGVQVQGARNGLGTSGLQDQLPEGSIWGILIKAEYQPEAIQDIGVISMGPTVGIYPEFPNATISKSQFSNWSAGAQIRYQARFFREQPIVPMAGYGFEYWNYALANGRYGGFMAKGPFLGGMLLLNFLDPSDAAAFYANYGVLRSYAVAEYRILEGGNGEVDLTGSSLFLGIRVEF